MIGQDLITWIPLEPGMDSTQLKEAGLGVRKGGGSQEKN